tara:strand:- start:680 stop:1825 length:1146 start_codon:yes stop_codon:yes gene_type:complete
MLKNKIYKYFTLEIAKSFFTILFAFTAIAWTVRAVNFLDLIVENGHSIKTYISFSLLNITNILSKFIPLSFLLALMLSIIKFRRQNELIILWSIGLNKIKVINLFFIISLFVLILQFCFAVIITPAALNKSRTLIKTSDFNSMNSIIKINDFSDSFDNVTFYVEKRNSLNEMENIFIRDEANTFKNIIASNEESENTTIIAKKGYIENKKLVLIDGLIQTQNNKGEINNINFKQTELVSSLLTPRIITVPKLQETSTWSLINCITRDNSLSNEKIINCPSVGIKKGATETVSRRIGMPMYIPLTTLICCFLIVSRKETTINFFGKYIFFFIGFLILVLAEILVRYSGFSDLNTLIYFLFPIIFTPLIYLLLINRLKFEKAS